MPSDALSGISSFMSSGGLLIILMIGMFALMIIPQRKREKKVKAMLEGIKEGDRIRTIGGFYGKVVGVKEDLLTIECGPDKVKLTISKSAVATVDTADVENEGGIKA